MTQKFFADASGNYIGAFDCGELPEEQRAEWFAKYVPVGAVEVPTAPEDARAVWNGVGWDEPPPDEKFLSIAAQVAALRAKADELEAVRK